MQALGYSLIVSDFDGTLVRSDGKISEENKRAIEKFIAAGGKFVISTGRLPSSILPRAKELGLQGALCCCQGSMIMDMQTETLLLSGCLPFESALAACAKMEQMGLHIQGYTKNEYYSNMDDEALAAYEHIVKIPANRVLDRPLSVFLRELNQPVYKLLAIVPKEENDRVLSSLQAEGFAGCDFTKSSDYFVEIIPAGYSKGTAVEYLANHYGVPLQNTIAVGDQRNDTPMVERAGLGVAVANADEELKARADYICSSTNDQDAVAKMIAKFVFHEEIEA